MGSRSILRSEWRKLVQFARPPALDAVTFTPWPWRDDPAPYHVANADPDTPHAGYERAHRFDQRGVPFRLDPQGHAVYDPLIVCRYALKLLTRAARRGDDDARRRAETLLPYLVDSARETACWGRGPRPDRMTRQAPSGLYQAFGISTVLRLSRGRPDAAVADLLDRAFRRLIAPAGAGGSTAPLRGFPFVQEHPQRRPTHNLCCCIDALFACWDLADTLDGPEHHVAADGLENAVAANLDLFRTRWGWSRYVLDLHGRALLASAHYHAGAAGRLTVLARRTDRQAFVDVAHEWTAALGSPAKRTRAAALKAAQVAWMRHVRRFRFDPPGQ